MKKIIAAIISVVIFASLLATNVSAMEFVRIWSDNEHPDYLAEYAGDGDIDQFWHTDWENGVTEPPYTIYFELDDVYSITSLGFLPRQGGNLNGLMYVFNILVSEDGENYTLVKEVDDFINSMDLQTVTFDEAILAKFIQFEIWETEGLRFASLNELEVTGEVHVPFVETVIEPESEEPETTEATAVEPVVEATVTAPQTSDAKTIYIVMMALSCMTAVILKKRSAHFSK